MKYTVILPFPISVDSAYANRVGRGVGRFRTKVYREWVDKCMLLDIKPIKVNPTTLIKATYTLYSKWYNNDGSIKRKDSNNYIKVVEDYLPIILQGFDDKQIWDTTTRKVCNCIQYTEKIIINLEEIDGK